MIHHIFYFIERKYNIFFIKNNNNRMKLIKLIFNSEVIVLYDNKQMTLSDIKLYCEKLNIELLLHW